MEDHDIKDYDFTIAAWETLYDAVDDAKFLDQDAQLIYYALRKRLKIRYFGDYLKRYIYQKAGLTGAYEEVSLKEYQYIIRDSFSDNHTPPSFTQTTAKLSALSKNWLTQRSVRRKVVFLLGFGLNMSVDDVNMFLTKALQEQEINPKDPFEVICWYCYNKRFNFLKFEQLWAVYSDIPANALDAGPIFGDQTIGARGVMSSIREETELIAYLATLKSEGISAMSAAARRCFDNLYNEARDIIAGIYNACGDERYGKSVHKHFCMQSPKEQLFVAEGQKAKEQFCAKRKVFSREDITESDIEHIISAAIPKDRHGNLRPGKASKLNEQFFGKRFSRQHIKEVLSGNVEITRFDLITLNFFNFSQKHMEYPESKTRYLKFCDSMNAILNECSLGELYVQNPYECFVLMCILSNDPLGTYADVWELSYAP